MKKSNILISVFFGLILSSCAPVLESKPALNITIADQTPNDICEVYASAEASNEWGANLLPEGQSISPGEERLFQQPAGVYDLLVRNCDGISVHSSAQVTADVSILIGGAGTVPLTIENTSNAEICYLYYSNQPDGDWGADQLGSVESILPEGQRIFYVPAGSYRLRVEDCSHTLLQETGMLEFGSGLTWAVGNPLQ